MYRSCRYHHSVKVIKPTIQHIVTCVFPIKEQTFNDQKHGLTGIFSGQKYTILMLENGILYTPNTQNLFAIIYKYRNNNTDN